MTREQLIDFMRWLESRGFDFSQFKDGVRNIWNLTAFVDMYLEEQVEPENQEDTISCPWQEYPGATVTTWLGHSDDYRNPVLEHTSCNGANCV